MRRRWVRIGTVVFVVVALGFSAALIAGQWDQLRSLRAEIGGFGWRLSPGWLAAALAIATVDLLWMGLAWVFLYRSAGGRLGYRTGLRVWLAANLGRYIPGKVWQISGLTLYLRRTGDSGTLALTTTVTFQVVTLLTGSAVALGILGESVALLPRGSPWAAGAVLLLLAVLLHPAVVRGATRLAARLLGEETEGLRVPPPADLIRLGGALTVAWGLYGVGLWCLLAGTMGDPPLGALALTGVFAASYVAGYLVLIAPGGLVVREGAMTALLSALAPIGAAVAAALAVLARIWVTASEILGLGVALLFPPRPAEGAGANARDAPGRADRAGPEGPNGGPG